MCRLALAVLAVACVGKGANERSEPRDPPDHPGDQTFQPPVEQEGDGQSPPEGSTGATCSALGECEYWFCRCADGALVNSSLCVNGFCMDAERSCPRACAYFGHGDWAGDAGGGPGTCGGLRSSDESCDSCFRAQCCSEGIACGRNGSCLDVWDCIVACAGDPGCQAECEAVFPDGALIYDALESCLLGACNVACTGAP